jgi:hypothetical protein
MGKEGVFPGFARRGGRGYREGFAVGVAAGLGALFHFRGAETGRKRGEDV